MCNTKTKSMHSSHHEIQGFHKGSHSGIMALLELEHRAHLIYRHKELKSKSKTKMEEMSKSDFYTRTPRHNPQHYEVLRLLTFLKYPREIPCSSILLARNGFMYTGKGTTDDDTVTCAFCLSSGNGVRDLTRSDEIETFHRKLNPQCDVVKGLGFENKLIEESCRERSFEAIIPQLYELRKKDSKRTVLTQIDEKEPSQDDMNTVLVSDSPEENLPRPNEEQQSSDLSRSPTHENCSGYSLQQAVEDAASSEIITNRAQSLQFPWQNAASEQVDGLEPLGNSINVSSSSAAGEPCDDIARPDGLPSSTPHSNTPPHVPSNATSSSDRNQNCGGQRNSSDTSRPHEQNSVSPDSSRASDIVNATPDSQTFTGNTTSSPQDLQSSSTDSGSPRQNENAAQNDVASYDKLGIYTARPKRPEYAVEQIRLESFEGWPEGHHISPTMLAKAGYFYTGYGDCARCFFCSGGLRNWEEGDDVWVEHARWFPKCTFIRQTMGQTFIDVVQDVSKKQEIVPYQDIIKEMEARNLEIVIPTDIEDKTTAELKKDVAVRTVLDNGFTMKDTIQAAGKLKDMGYSMSSDLIFDELVKMGARKMSSRAQDKMDSGSRSTRGRPSSIQGTMESLTKENNDLRQQSLCKICLDKEVAVVFLPCGHFVSCNDCSYALKACPMCRESIKGVVRGHLS